MFRWLVILNIKGELRQQALFKSPSSLGAGRNARMNIKSLLKTPESRIWEEHPLSD